MNILYLTHQYFPRHVGGVEVYTRGLVRRMTAGGHRVMVLTCHEEPSGDPARFHVERTEHEGTEVVEIHANLSVSEHPARCEYDHAYMRHAVEDELRGFLPDVVHVMHAMKLSGAAVRACTDRKVPTVVTLSDYWFICPRHTLLTWDGKLCDGPTRPYKCVACVRDLHGFALRPTSVAGARRWLRDRRAIRQRAGWLRATLLATQRIIALSGFAKQMFVVNRYPAGRIDVIPHGLEIDDLRVEDNAATATSAPGHPLRIGFIASLVPSKGAHVLIEALGRVPDLPMELLVFGAVREGDAYVSKLRAMAQRDARVKLMGAFAPSEFGKVMRQFDVLAAPAVWYENEPLVIKAAAWMGKPVLASRIGSLTEMVESLGCGRLVEPGNVEAWARALRRAVEEPISLAMPGRVKTMDQNAEEMLEIYRSLTGKH